MRDAMDFFLAFGMLATGSVNTIVTKFADGVCERNEHDAPLLYDPKHTDLAPFWGPAGTTPGGSSPEDKQLYEGDGPLAAYNCIQFNHPFVQAAFMFLGEILCGVVYVALRCARKGEPMPYFNPLYLAVAGMCDMTATSMMYVGLTMTYASTFQILRGVVVVFTSLFSHFVLGRKQQPFQWLGVVLVVVGTGVVGLAPFAPAPWGLPSSGSDAGASNPALGNFIIIIAQVVVGIQMCWEERYVTEYNIPALLVVGWEGLFGLFAIHILLTVVHQIHDFAPEPSAVVMDNATKQWCAPHPNNGDWGGGSSDTAFWFGEDDAFKQFASEANNPTIIIAMSCMVFSIAFFNFFGISVTKKMSAAHRMVLDSVRTCVVWAVGLIFLHEHFAILQAIGFVILITGTLVYNTIVRVPGMDYSAHDNPAPEDPIKKGRKEINVAITDRDFGRAAACQQTMLQNGDHSYAQRRSIGPPELEAPLLTPSTSVSRGQPSLQGSD